MQQASIVKSSSAFSLVEVVLAIGLFVFAIVGVIGLFGPAMRSATEAGASEAVSGVLARAEGELRQMAYDEVLVLANGHPVLFADASGLNVRQSHDPKWGGSNGGKFFEILLHRNQQLSPAGQDGASAHLVLWMEVRWPAYLPDGTEITTLSAKQRASVTIVINR